jgi:hypothetical protein
MRTHRACTDCADPPVPFAIIKLEREALEYQLSRVRCTHMSRHQSNDAIDQTPGIGVVATFNRYAVNGILCRCAWYPMRHLLAELLLTGRIIAFLRMLFTTGCDYQVKCCLIGTF